ncbi:hypothetical protein D3C71_1929270 [compost metagenome]
MDCTLDMDRSDNGSWQFNRHWLKFDTIFVNDRLCFNDHIIWKSFNSAIVLHINSIQLDFIFEEDRFNNWHCIFITNLNLIFIK